MLSRCKALLLAAFLAIIVVAQPFPSKASGTSKPTQKCATEPGQWNATEKKVWTEQICVGLPVDLDALPPDQAVLTSGFLRDILLDSRWHKALPAQGVEIRNAIFLAPVLLDNVDLDAVLRLEDCAFQYGISFHFSTSKRFISLNGSNVVGGLDMSGLFSQSSISIQDIEANWIDIRGLKTTEGVSISRSNILLKKMRVDQKLDTSTLPSDIRVDDIGSILADRASIGGDLAVIDVVAKALSINGIVISGSLILDHRADLSPVTKGQTGSILSTIDGRLSHIKGDVRIKKAVIDTDLLLDEAHIDGNLELDDNLIADVDATDATIGGTLFLNVRSSKADWKSNSALNLRNCTISRVEVSPKRSAWPAEIDLNNTSFKDFDFIDSGERRTDSRFGSNDARLYLDWLALSMSQSPQPYTEIADIFKARGDKNSEKQVRIAERERARASDHGIIWLYESMKSFFIGYGYNLTNAWISAAFMIVLGRFVLFFSNKARIDGLGFVYSFDQLVPVLTLNKANSDKVLERGIREYFYIHRLIGFDLATFLVAGISGLTNLT